MIPSKKFWTIGKLQNSFLKFWLYCGHLLGHQVVKYKGVVSKDYTKQTQSEVNIYKNLNSHSEGPFSSVLD